MTVSFDIPRNLEASLVAQLGDLGQAAKEAFVIHQYQAGRISAGIVAQLLELDDRFAADAWLKARSVVGPLTAADVAEDAAELRALLSDGR